MAARLTIDNEADARFYDKGVVNAYDIIGGSVRSNSDIAKRFLKTSHAVPVRAWLPPPPAAPAGTTAPISAAPAAGSGAQTFPMSDPKPGQEPQSH